MVEAEENHAAKRRARDAALAAELDAALAGAFGDAAAGAAAKTTTEGSRVEHASVPSTDGSMRPPRRRFQRVKMTLSVADARDAGRVQELVQTVMATSRKRGQDEASIQPTEASTTTSAPVSGFNDAISSAGRREVDADQGEDASKAPPTKKVTRLERAPVWVGGGAGAPGEKPDAMSNYFRMYDLVCNEQEEEKVEKSETASSSAARKPAGCGLQKVRRGVGEVTTTSDAGGGDKKHHTPQQQQALPGVDVSVGEEEEDLAERLMCNYMPMVREYLGDDTTAAANEKIADGETMTSNDGRDDLEGGDGVDRGEDGGYVYDVYVQVEDDAAYGNTVSGGRANGKESKMSRVDDTQRGQGDTSVIYVGAQDTELFFDAMDGLVDDESDDVDSEDSNREDAPFADYPDEEEDSQDEWGSGGDSDGPRLRMEGFYHPGGIAHGGVDSDGEPVWDYDDEDDLGFSSYRQAGVSSSDYRYRETAYDPEYDDVTDYNYYS